MQGWITLNRELLTHWIWSNQKYGHAWVTMLMIVNHTDQKVLCGTEVTLCRRGETIRSYEQWVHLFGKGWSTSSVFRFFEKLKKENMIVTKPAIKATHLTIVNYEGYQNKREALGNELATERQATEIVAAQNNNDNNDPTMINHVNNTRPPKPWHMIQLETTWIAQIKSKGAKIGEGNWQHWNTLIEDHTIEAVLEALVRMNGAEKWPDAAEKILHKNKYNQPTNKGFTF